MAMAKLSEQNMSTQKNRSMRGYLGNENGSSHSLGRVHSIVLFFGHDNFDIDKHC